MTPEKGAPERRRARRWEDLFGQGAALAERRPRLLLVGVLLLTVFFATQLPRVRVTYDPLAFLPPTERVELFRWVERTFGVGSFSHRVVVRLAPRPGYSVEHPQALREMEAVLQGLRRVPGVLRAQGLPDLVKFVRQELYGGDRRYAVLPPDEGPDERGYTLSDLIRLTFQRMTLAQQFVSPQGTALITATLAPEVDLRAAARALQEVLGSIQREAQALRIDVLSYGQTLNVFQDLTRRDLQRLLPAVAALVVGVLLWVFRLTRRRELVAASGLVLTVAALAWGPLLLPLPPGGVLAWEAMGSIVLGGVLAKTFRPLVNLYLPLLVVGVSGVWTFGALGALGLPFTFLMVAVVPLLLGVGIDDALHLLHRYEEERGKGRSSSEAMGIALRRTGRALLLTTLTTAAGFAALLGAPSPPLQAFGLLAAGAMISAFLVTVALVPPLKVLLPQARPANGHPRPRRSGLSRLLAAYARGTARPGIAGGVLLLALLLGFLGYGEGWAFPTYSVDYRRFLPPDHPLAQLYTRVNREFRPYEEVQIVLRGDLLRWPALRLLLYDAPSALAGSPYAQGMVSFVQVLEDLRTTNADLNAGFSERFPDDPEGAYRWLLATAWAEERLRARLVPYVRPLPDGSLEAVVRINTLRFTDSEGISRLTRDLSRRLEPLLRRWEAFGIEARVTGTPYLEEIGLAALRRSFTRSLLLSFVLCFGVLAWAFRSMRWALLALSPAVLTTGIVLGSVRLAHIELNVATAVVAALSLGLGIDYAIHLLHRFREERSLEVAVARTGEALSAAFVTTSSAFLALLGGQIAWNRDFGLLVGLAVALAFATAVLFLPALLRFVPPPFPASNPTSAAAWAPRRIGLRTREATPPVGLPHRGSNPSKEESL